MRSSQMIKKIAGSQLGPLFALIFILALIGIGEYQYGKGVFFSASNIRAILNSSALIAIPAMGMTLIIIAGGIDLSAGTCLALCATVMAWTLEHTTITVDDPGYSMMILKGISLTVLCGILCGLINGGLVSTTKVVPFIVTLGTMYIFVGLGQLFAEESTIGPPRELIPSWMRDFCYTGPEPDKYFFSFLPSVPTSAVLMLIIAVVVSLILKFTVFGRNVFAVGSSESTARLCGINIMLTTTLVYVIAGFLVSIGGLLEFANVKVADPGSGFGKELPIIAAVVLGGGSLSGGRGSVLGTLVGVLMITSIKSGCVLTGIPNTYTLIIIGAMIIIAVIVDQLKNGSPEWFFRLMSKHASTT